MFIASHGYITEAYDTLQRCAPVPSPPTIGTYAPAAHLDSDKSVISLPNHDPPIVVLFVSHM